MDFSVCIKFYIESIITTKCSEDYKNLFFYGPAENVPIIHPRALAYTKLCELDDGARESQ